MFFGRRSFSILSALGFLILTPAFAQNAASAYVKAIYSLPLSLDPIKMNDTASLAVGNLIYDGLLKFSPSLCAFRLMTATHFGSMAARDSASWRPPISA